MSVSQSVLVLSFIFDQGVPIPLTDTTSSVTLVMAIGSTSIGIMFTLLKKIYWLPALVGSFISGM
jgi:hypothetical protein